MDKKTLREMHTVWHKVCLLLQWQPHGGLGDAQAALVRHPWVTLFVHSCLKDTAMTQQPLITTFDSAAAPSVQMEYPVGRPLTSDELKNVAGGSVARAQNWVEMAAYGTTDLQERLQYLQYAYNNMANL